jgi:hypothetical protein
MTVKVAVEFCVVPWLVLENERVCELYAVSRGIGLGGALDDDELDAHEKVVVAVEVEDVDEAVELEVDGDALIEADEEATIAELEVLIAELTEEEVVVEEPLLLSARYAAVPPTASTTITTTAITA